MQMQNSMDQLRSKYRNKYCPIIRTYHGELLVRIEDKAQLILEAADVVVAQEHLRQVGEHLFQHCSL